MEIEHANLPDFEKSGYREADKWVDWVLGHALMKEAKSRGHEIKILDIGGGFPAPYNKHVKPFSALAKKINGEIARLSTAVKYVAEPPA